MPISQEIRKITIQDIILKIINSLLQLHLQGAYELTHWGLVTHICVDNLTIIGSDNGLSPGRHQAITWTNVGILLIEPLGTNFSEMLIEIHTFSFKKIHLKMSSGKWRPFCLGLNMLTQYGPLTTFEFIICWVPKPMLTTMIENQKFHSEYGVGLWIAND